MKAISIRQPWVWMILNAGKDIENRTWRTHFRGTVLIHASKAITTNDYLEVTNFWIDIGADELHKGATPIPEFWNFDQGGIIGQVDIVDCVIESDSPWFVGPFGFVLRNPRILPFRPCKGALGFFNPKL